MVIKTKKYKLSPEKYFRIAIISRLKSDWWVFLIGFFFVASYFFVKSKWVIFLGFIGVALYFGFWAFQYFGLRYLPQAQNMFVSLTYEFSAKNILCKICPKTGFTFEWSQIKKVIFDKKHVLLKISAAQFIYLPFSVFFSESDLTFFNQLIKSKKLGKK